MLRSRYNYRPDQRHTATVAGAVDDDVSHLTSPLERLNITTPPGAVFAGAEAYDKTAEKYASRPLPPVPPPRRSLRSPQPNITGARTPVQFRRRRDLPPATPAAVAAAGKLSSEKPLPPSPSSSSSSLIRRGGRGSRSYTRRCQSPSNLPTGHRSHKKVQKVMGCDVDVHDDGRGSRPESGYLSGSSEQSQSGSPTLARREYDDPLYTGLPTPSTLGSEMSWEATRRHIAHEAQRPPTPAEQSSSHQRFSNAQAARDYHRFATELAVDRPSTSEGIQGQHRQQQQRRQQPQRFAVTKPSFFRRSRGFSATLNVLSSSSSSGRRCSPPRPIDVSQISPLLAGQGQGGDGSSSNPDERPGSAFESDSDDDDEKGKIVDSIRGFVSIRKGGESRSSSRTKRHGEESDQSPRGLLGRAKEWHASRASDKAGRDASQEEEPKTRWREQLKNNIEVKSGRRMC
ncbi:hypothetical protein ACRE_010330 [Hapsidospora chrysogenum ATCC 11550]|uniref:Uncharacterized protein n=1 Tax=Hapsidospora chrysogenum (strain ATCC 11550 / CBS 779.69 / DSM 880 / IAM 14645 / JCM 23072 / IMI 49137) TaxID=857340 RepID=A0A086TFB5_HAPC1|nr:hypothetical protein ACRE_010330 [Hapsidospora chrysogenum ATCC 11550]